MRLTLRVAALRIAALRIGALRIAALAALAASPVLSAACGEATTQPPVVVIPSSPPPPPPGAGSAAKTAEAAPAPPPDVGPAADAALDLWHAPRVSLRASPPQATVQSPIGARPPKPRTLTEIARVADGAPLKRAEARPAPYDPRRLNEVHDTPATLPPGARADIPTSFFEEPLRAISESGGRLLLVYGPRYLAVASGKKVEAMLDLDPPELRLTENDRLFSDVHSAVYQDGVTYVCRGYNGWLRSRKGYVTAVDVATGEMRWRSPAQTCGGVLAVVDEYVITGYGEDVMPYALKLLFRADGTVAQSIRNKGAALDFLVDGSRVVVETYKHRITYELR